MRENKILVADDESEIRLMVNRMLGKDYFVLEAANGKEAVNVARLQKPDLVLMDIMMPDMDGYSACHAIKSDPETRNIPVIMVTGIEHELNLKLSREMGADGYITKPFSLEELVETVERFVTGTG
jgi:two-component system, OmpR family, alkaline phosphatase synthesis response regulator PhoP